MATHAAQSQMSGLSIGGARIIVSIRVSVSVNRNPLPVELRLAPVALPGHTLQVVEFTPRRVEREASRGRQTAALQAPPEPNPVEDRRHASERPVHRGDIKDAVQVDAVAADIAECVGDREVILAGGSVANHELVRRVRLHCDPDTDVVISDELGIPAAAREALGFAVFGALSQDHVPISLPQVTGGAEPGRAGAWILP